MATSLSSQIQDVLPKTQDTYYKLILAVGPARAGKTAALTELAAKHKWPRVNVNLCLIGEAPRADASAACCPSRGHS